MQGTLLVMLVLLFPAVTALLMLVVRAPLLRKATVIVFSLAMIVVSVLIGYSVLTQGMIIIDEADYPWVNDVVSIIDWVVMIVIFYFGVKLREWKIIVPTVLSAALVAYYEFMVKPAEAAQLVIIDNLSMVLLLISSILGPLIAIFALGYMDKHEAEHSHGQENVKSRQHIFLGVIFLFLFAMNALSITNNIAHLLAFWEITTLCSFLLIGHDDTEDCRVSARRALWMNSVAGLFFAGGIAVIATVYGSLSISTLNAHGYASGALLAGIMLICCAGFVKSAQMPFQPWLLGAMVAPTPVSALLHSSTMVKAGVYVVVRFSPTFGGHLPGYLIGLVGAFTFMAASVLAMGQSNAKRVLAYSTVANLGLIISCAGIGGNAALAAAILLIIFHAVSKGLLFLCVGTVEQGIGSRDIEDMYGVYTKMPYTTVIMVIGLISMVLPPFGVLITKWLALEASTVFAPVLFLIILGSALTIAYYAKWLGSVLTVYKTDRPKNEGIAPSQRSTLGIMAAMAIVLTALISPLNDYVVTPAVQSLIGKTSAIEGTVGGIAVNGASGATGGFGGVILLLGVIVVGMLLVRLYTKASKPKYVPPYACGELVEGDDKGKTVVGPADQVYTIRNYSYYMKKVLEENRLTVIGGFISVMLILIMFGVS